MAFYSDSSNLIAGDTNDKTNVFTRDLSVGSEGNDTLWGGNGNDKLWGLGGDDTLNGSDGRDTLLGGDGNDVLSGGIGGDVLTGDSGNDQFVYHNFKERSDKITDFNPDNDLLVLKDLFVGSGYSGSNPISDSYVKLVQLGASDTKVQIDLDGPSGFTAFKTLVTLKNVLPTALNATNILI